MRRTTFTLLAMWCLVLVLGCGSHPPPGKLDAEDQFLLAKETFDDGKYLDAQTEFQKLLWNYPGSEYVDEAQYYLAECFRQQEDYPAAVIEYGRLIRNYSQSPFAAAAQYKLALCYYEQSLPSRLDQEYTHKTIEEIQLFLDDYPNSEYVPQAQDLLLQARTKLAQKEYDNANLYCKMGDYNSAIIYLEELLRDYADTKWADEAQYLMGECYRHQKKWDQALASYRRVLTMGASGKFIQRAQKRIDQIEKKLQDALEPS